MMSLMFCLFKFPMAICLTVSVLCLPPPPSPLPHYLSSPHRLEAAEAGQRRDGLGRASQSRVERGRISELQGLAGLRPRPHVSSGTVVVKQLDKLSVLHEVSAAS